MGANLDYIVIGVVPRSEAEQIFNEAADESRFMSGHSYSGQIGMLDGIDNWVVSYPRRTEKEAIAYISEHARKWEGAIAVLAENGWVIGGICPS